MKIGLALSGGGARGFAHLGILQALHEKDIRPDVIAGTSAGAMVGAFYSAGFAPTEIFKIFTQTSFGRSLRPALSARGLLRMDFLEVFFRKYLSDDAFEKLSIPLTISATDLVRGKTVYFSEGPLIRPLLATACIPALFQPVEIGDHFYVDGGLLNNLPVDPLIGYTDYVIGVNVNHYHVQSDVKSVRKVLEKCFQLAISTNAKARIQQCDLYMEPPALGLFSIFEVGKAQDIYDIGYRYAIKLDLDDIR